MDSTTLAKAVKLNEELEKVKADIAALDERNRSNPKIGVGYADGHDEQKLNNIKPLNYEYLCRSAVNAALAKKKQEIEEEIAAL